jgi:hypothetical protein
MKFFVLNIHLAHAKVFVGSDRFAYF